MGGLASPQAFGEKSLEYSVSYLQILRFVIFNMANKFLHPLIKDRKTLVTIGEIGNHFTISWIYQ